MFALIVTTIIYSAGSAEEIAAVHTASVPGFANEALCQSAAEKAAGQVLNVERQAICVQTQ